MSRHRNVDWYLPGNDTDKTVTNDIVKMAVLMDIRDELQKLNAVFACHNARAIPGLLRRIARNTTKKRKPRK